MSPSTLDLPLNRALPDDGSRRLFAVFEKLGAARWALEVDDAGRPSSMHWSPEFRRLTGYSDDSPAFPEDVAFIFSIVHPDDLVTIRRALWAALSDASGRTNYDVVYRIKDELGRYHWYRAVGKHAPERTASGRHLFYGLLFRNDSEQAVQTMLAKRREALLRVNESLQKQTAELEALRKKENEDLARLQAMHAAIESDRVRLVQRMRVIEALSLDCNAVWIVHVPSMTISLVRNNGASAAVPAIPAAARTNSLAAAVRLYAEQCVHCEDREKFITALAYDNIRQQISSRPLYEFVYRRVSNGETNWYQAVISLADPGRSDDFVAGFRCADALVKKDAEEKAELEATLHAARQANNNRTQFLNAISHDIRTPMNAIAGMTALASEHLGNPERVTASLQKITDAGRDLLSLINNVLDLSRLESGKLALTHEALRLPNLCEAVSDRVAALVQKKPLAFSFTVDRLFHETVTGDPARLSQIMLSLAENAVKFTPAGGLVTLSLTETGVRDGEASYLFCCGDNGIGMTEDFQRRLFSPFSRAKTMNDAGVTGSGLGLAVTKRLLALMAGDIRVASRPGEGSLFSAAFRLPVRETPCDSPAALQGKRVLLVNDSADEGRAAVQTLRDLGVEALWTASGEASPEAWREAAAAGRPFDLVLIDWRMPGINGVETARRLRPLAGPDVPFILFSAYDMAMDHDAATAAGITSFLKKPLFRSTLRKSLLTALAGGDAGCEASTGSVERPRSLRRVLLAEDNELNREIATEILSSLGLAVETAANGREALALYESHPAGWYDLVMMDLEMPVMTGLEAARLLRRSLRSDAESLPLVAMSASTRAEDREAAREADLTIWLAKPADRAAFAAVVSQCLSLSGGAL